MEQRERLKVRIGMGMVGGIIVSTVGDKLAGRTEMVLQK